MTDESCDSLNQVNDFISSIAEKIHSEQVDIQTKRLFKRYAARKQEDMERRKQVWIHYFYNIKLLENFIILNRQQWKRIELTEPRVSLSTNSDENLQIGNRDTVADVEAHENQTIVDKYRLLKSLKFRMTKIKRDFNESVLKLLDEKLKKSSILCSKIEELNRIYSKLHHKNKNNKIVVKEYTEKVAQFDGKTFKVALSH